MSIALTLGFPAMNGESLKLPCPGLLLSCLLRQPTLSFMCLSGKLLPCPALPCASTQQANPGTTGNTTLVLA